MADWDGDKPSKEGRSKPKMPIFLLQKRRTFWSMAKDGKLLLFWGTLGTAGKFWVHFDKFVEK